MQQIFSFRRKLSTSEDVTTCYPFIAKARSLET